MDSDACIAGVGVSREALVNTVAGGDIGEVVGNSVSVVGDRSLPVVDDARGAERHGCSTGRVR